MAQAKRKRRTKHRGNAAGTVEVRGRTGRPATPEEKKRQERDGKRQARMMKQPTWSSSIKRSLLAASFMFVFLLITSHPKHGSALITAAAFAVVAFAIYLPAGYYLEVFLYNRRLAKQAGTAKR
jgi:hypothetical protein